MRPKKKKTDKKLTPWTENFLLDKYNKIKKN